MNKSKESLSPTSPKLSIPNIQISRSSEANCSKDSLTSSLLIASDLVSKSNDEEQAINVLERLVKQQIVTSDDWCSFGRGNVRFQLLHPSFIPLIVNSCGIIAQLGLSFGPKYLDAIPTRSNEVCLLSLCYGGKIIDDINYQLISISPTEGIDKIPLPSRLGYFKELKTLGTAGYLETRAADPTNWLLSPEKKIFIKNTAILAADKDTIGDSLSILAGALALTD